MLNQEAVKQFFLELYKEEKNSQPEKSLEFFHGKKLSGSRECCGVYLYYQHLWFEEKYKNQNVINESGFFIVNTMKDTLWTIHYDGWHEGDEEVASLQREGFIKTLQEINQEWKQTVSLEKNGLKYQNEIDGLLFSLFDLKETITNYSNCVSFYQYRSRTLVSF